MSPAFGMKAEKLHEIKHWRNVFIAFPEGEKLRSCQVLECPWHLWDSFKITIWEIAHGKGRALSMKKKKKTNNFCCVLHSVQANHINLLPVEAVENGAVLPIGAFLNTSSELSPARCREKPLVPFVALLSMRQPHCSGRVLQVCCSFLFCHN